MGLKSTGAQLHKCLLSDYRETVVGGVAGPVITLARFVCPLVFVAVLLTLPLTLPFSFPLCGCHHILRDTKLHETQFLPSRKSQSVGRDGSRTGNMYLYVLFCLKADSDKITVNQWGVEALLH